MSLPPPQPKECKHMVTKLKTPKASKNGRVNNPTEPNEVASAPFEHTNGSEPKNGRKSKLDAALAQILPLTNEEVAQVCLELQQHQRQRAVVMKSRIMQENRILHIVAGTLGYRSGLDEKSRAKVFGEARTVIKAVLKGTGTHPMGGVINTTYTGINAFLLMQREIEKVMVKLAKRLPMASWVEHPDRRGFSILGLAIVVGESGDIGSYSNPGKLWKRLGCAPYEYKGKTAMGATWRGGKEGSLPSDQWAKFGYSPRRRSISYLIGEGIVKQNGIPLKADKDKVGEASTETDGSGADDHLSETDEGLVGENQIETEESTAVVWKFLGPYRARYNKVKEEAAVKHPDWVKLRRHRHAMLLATKMLLKELWVEWRKKAGTYTKDGDWEAKGAMDRVAGRYGE